MNNEEKKKNMPETECSRVLHCSAFGNLRPSDICEGCEDCKRNVKFEEKGGLPGMLLTGSRENLSNAMRVPGVAMEDVVVVNAKRYQAMEDALKKIAEYDVDTEDFEALGQCGYLKSVARKALEV